MKAMTQDAVSGQDLYRWRLGVSQAYDVGCGTVRGAQRGDPLKETARGWNMKRSWSAHDERVDRNVLCRRDPDAFCFQVLVDCVDAALASYA